MQPRCSPFSARPSRPMQYISAGVAACALRFAGTPRKTTTRRSFVSSQSAASCAHVLSATARGATTTARLMKPRRKSSAIACSVIAVFPAPMSAQIAMWGRIMHAQTISFCSSVNFLSIAISSHACTPIIQPMRPQRARFTTKQTIAPTRVFSKAMILSMISPLIYEMPGREARYVLSHVAALAGDVIKSESPEEIGHLLFRAAGQDGPIVSVVAELVFLFFTRELNVVPPNPVAGMNFANRDFDVEVLACHDISSCGSNPAKPVRGTIPPPDKSRFRQTFYVCQHAFLNFFDGFTALIFRVISDSAALFLAPSPVADHSPT